jgi:hypothetical protein
MGQNAEGETFLQIVCCAGITTFRVTRYKKRLAAHPTIDDSKNTIAKILLNFLFM